MGMSVAYETVKFVQIGERVGKRQPGQQQVGRKGLVGIFLAIFFSWLRWARHCHLVAVLWLTEAAFQGKQVLFAVIFAKLFMKRTLFIPSN